MPETKLNTMKKLIYTLAISGAALCFQSCGSSAENSSENTDSTATMSDTMMNDNSTMSSMGLADTTFTSQAAISGMAEVELGKLAMEKATNAKIKDFAAMMVKDHSKANEELKTIAQSKNIALPAMLDAEHQSKMEELKAKTGTEFDKAYAKAMVEGHQKTLNLMNQGSSELTDNELKAFATKTAPVVKHHLEMITSIQGELK